MKIIKIFKNKEAYYDSFKDKKSIYKLNINDVNFKVDFKDIIRTQFSLGNIKKDKIDEIKKKLNLGDYSKAPCGGFVNFYKYNINDICYIVYSGVNEVSNSYYIVNLHKIIQLNE